MGIFCACLGKSCLVVCTERHNSEFAPRHAQPSAVLFGSNSSPRPLTAMPLESTPLSSAVMLVVGPALAAVRSLRRHKQAKQAMRDDDKLLLDISVHSAASTSCSSSTSDSSERVGWHPHPPVGRWGRYAVSANDPGQVAAVSASQASCDEWYRRQITY